MPERFGAATSDSSIYIRCWTPTRTRRSTEYLEYFEVAIVSSNKKKVIAKALQEHGLQDPHLYSCGKKNKRKKFARLLAGIRKPGKVLVVSRGTSHFSATASTETMRTRRGQRRCRLDTS